MVWAIGQGREEEAGRLRHRELGCVSSIEQVFWIGNLISATQFNLIVENAHSYLSHKWVDGEKWDQSYCISKVGGGGNAPALVSVLASMEEDKRDGMGH